LGNSKPAGTPALDPADAGIGLPAQRLDGDPGPTHLGAERLVLEPRDQLNNHECELATGCAQHLSASSPRAIYREFGPPDDPAGFFLGPALLEVCGHAAAPSGRSVMIWIQVRDVHAEHARLAVAAVPIVREPAVEPWA